MEQLNKDVFRKNIRSDSEEIGSYWIESFDQFEAMWFDQQARNAQTKLNQVVIDEKPTTIRDAIKSAIKEVKINELLKANNIGVKLE